MLQREGRHLGLPTLRAEFPAMPRCELGELQAAYRQHYRATHRRSVERLTWHGVGRVWAIDHVVPPDTIDGVDRAVLAVRDLASGAQLAWQPVPDQTELPTTAVVHSLIHQHGPPLLLKSDNGSAFKSEEFNKLLAGHEVVWLPSPPRTPWYNGGCEAGNHSMRTRTNHFAEPARRWTGEALAAARRQANALTRPEGHLGPTPAQRWSARTPIDPAQRQQLVAAIERHSQQIIAERKDNFCAENKNHQHQVLRQAARRALLELGLLTITRRSISPPLKRKKQDKIS
jgi:transposase InsO family protein